MKKSSLNYVFLILIAFQISVSATAQNFKAGVFLGISSSQVSGDQLAGFNKAGWYGGGFVNTPIGEKTSAQMEISFIGKGSRPTSEQADALPDNPYPTLNYVEIPILLIYKTKSNLSIEAGLAFGVLVYSREEDLYSEVPIKRPYNKSDISFILGLDYLLSEKISLNSRLDNSFLPIRDHESGATYGLNQGQYNTEITFSLRYHF
ncbi:MAG: PorT family protein [Bacteroidia bacterium]|nr:PorT family protein [Bacteroidia bacterium]